MDTKDMQQVRIQRETYDKLREYKRRLKYRIPLSDLITKAVELFLYTEGFADGDEDEE